MIAALSVLHVIVCVFLIAVVLLQRGKGAEMGAVFGGGASSTVFGSRGAGNFLTMLTKICAAVFMLTSLSLSYLYTQQAGEGLFEDGIDAIQEDPFEPLDAVIPEKANLETPQTDPSDSIEPVDETTPRDAIGDGAIFEKPARDGASAPDGSP